MTRVYSLPEASGGGSALMSAASMGAVHPNAVEAFVRIRLACQTVPELFETWLLGRPAVSGVWSLTGDFDYEVRCACAALHDLAAELRAMRRSGAEHTDTCLLLREVVAVRSTHPEGD
jgi:hypothetical protein